MLTRLLLFFVFAVFSSSFLRGDELLAGVGKMDITRPGEDAGDNPPLVKALVLSQGEINVVIITVDAVAIAEIGSIRDPYLAEVRSQLAAFAKIEGSSVIVNVSHCHALVADDIVARTVEAVRIAWGKRVPVKAGAGIGQEDSIIENRRLHLKNGKEADVRHAYALPPDAEIAAVGPIDSRIGLLRFDRVDNGQPLALVYQFACHPIQGIPSGGNTADLTGFASKVIEENLGDSSGMAFFLQGCGGDINPVLYKSPTLPRDGEIHGTKLGLSALAGARTIKTSAEVPLVMQREILTLPRADHGPRIAEMEAEINALADSLKGTKLNFETFLPLYVKYHLSPEFPSEASHRYLQDELLQKEDWKTLDANNRAAMDAYLRNIHAMEELTRKQINLALLEKHQAKRLEVGDSVTAEVVGLRVGDFRLVTFPAELTVEIGLELQEKSPHPLSFVSGYTNGYLYYAPTPEQMKNRGGAQEDSDSILAPEWLATFEETALKMLGGM